MFSRVRIAIRFFFVGLAVGILLAPRSGRETRRIVRERADRLLNDVLDAATLGTYESGAGATDEIDDLGGEGGGNGSGTSPGSRPRRTRTTAARTGSRSGESTASGASGEASAEAGGTPTEAAQA